MRVRMAGLVVAVVLLSLAGLTGWLFGVFQPDIPSAPESAMELHLETVAEGFDRPVQVVEADGALFVVEQGGLLKTLDGNVTLDLRNLTKSGGERGFLSAAWRNGTWFTHHSGPAGETVLSRWDEGVQTVLWTHAQPYSNHNGGMLAFGPDGMLYLGLGDGGLAADPHGNGQDTDTHLGGILRFDASGPTVQAPPDNPFRDGSAPYLYHYGLRNPWRFSFDMATGDLWIGDVGQGNVEEIDHVPNGTSGANFGWVTFEGSHRFRPGDAPGHVRPVAQYDHDEGCSVTGGHVVRDGSALDGTYLFGDYCSGQVWLFDGELRRGPDTDLRITSFGQDGDGRVYVVDHGGAVYRVTV